MNACELPFLKIHSRTAIAAIYVPTNTICFNTDMVLNLTESSKVERVCEGIISHETIHGVILECEDLDTSIRYDNFDDWWNEYIYSIIPQS